MARIRTDLSNGRRLYVETKYGEPVVAELKSLGAKWEPESRCWWLGTAKRAALEALLRSGENLDPRDPVEKAAKADQLEEAGKPEEAAQTRAAVQPKQDPHDIRLTGKGRYKGRDYYAGAITRDGLRVRLLTLPDAQGDYLDFWADCSEVEQIKTYAPREVWDGRRYSGKTRLEYTTLGSIADFIRRQKNPDTARGECTECGHWGPRGETCTECHEGTHS